MGTIFFLKVNAAEHYSRLGLLTREEQYIYQEIMWRNVMCWPIPANPEQLANCLATDVDSVRGVLTKLDWLFVIEGPMLHHVEVLEATTAAAELSEKRAEAGRKGMESRWSDDNKSNNKSYNKSNNKSCNKSYNKPTYTSPCNSYAIQSQNADQKSPNSGAADYE